MIIAGAQNGLAPAERHIRSAFSCRSNGADPPPEPFYKHFAPTERLQPELQFNDPKEDVSRTPEQACTGSKPA
jgi:hypothetical protein